VILIVPLIHTVIQNQDLVIHALQIQIVQVKNLKAYVFYTHHIIELVGIALLIQIVNQINSATLLKIVYKCHARIILPSVTKKVQHLYVLEHLVLVVLLTMIVHLIHMEEFVLYPVQIQESVLVQLILIVKVHQSLFATLQHHNVKLVQVILNVLETNTDPIVM